MSSQKKINLLSLLIIRIWEDNIHTDPRLEKRGNKIQLG